jgi:hypothetical protein
VKRRGFIGSIAAFVAGMIWDPELNLWRPSKEISIPTVTLAEHKLYYCGTHGSMGFLDTVGSYKHHEAYGQSCLNTWNLATPENIKSSKQILDFNNGIERRYLNPNYVKRG